MRRVGGVSRGVREDAVGIYERMMASSRTVGERAGRGASRPKDTRRIRNTESDPQTFPGPGLHHSPPVCISLSPSRERERSWQERKWKEEQEGAERTNIVRADENSCLHDFSVGFWVWVGKRNWVEVKQTRLAQILQSWTPTNFVPKLNELPT